MSNPPAIEISHLAHRYGEHEAIRDLSLSVAAGEIFALLGPNGSGKTTLFRVLSTLIPLQQGEVHILGYDLRREPDAIRAQLGVVFQAPSVDKKLTVMENIIHHGRLYGLGGRELRTRADEMLARLGLADRRRDLVETLSGGLRRRVELAKGMLHRPRLLLLDEPSTGLDPGARSDLWQYLEQVRDEDGVTVVLTTHLLEEAERADRIAIMHRGELAALDTPAALQAAVGGDAITIRTTRRRRAGRRHRRSSFNVQANGRRRLGAARAAGRPPMDPRSSRRFPTASTRSRSASRRSKTCSSTSPATVSGTNGAQKMNHRGTKRHREEKSKDSKSI